MNLHRWLSISFLCLFLAVTPGCGGGGAKVNVEGNKTVGQELTDLDAAYQKGTINREEYDKIRKRIIDGK